MLGLFFDRSRSENEILIPCGFGPNGFSKTTREVFGDVFLVSKTIKEVSFGLINCVFNCVFN